MNIELLITFCMCLGIYHGSMWVLTDKGRLFAAGYCWLMAVLFLLSPIGYHIIKELF